MRKIAIFFGAFMQLALMAQTSTFTILTFNDVYEIVPDSRGRGGFAEIYTLLENERAQAKHHITTMNGDFLSPCILSTFDRGAHRIKLFNEMGIDVVVLGNHEFDFGPDVVLQRVKESNFPWLAANALGLDGKPFTGDKQTIILDVEGIKIGFFGLITVDTPNLSATGQKVCFLPLVHTAREKIAELKKQGAEVIVALTHLHMQEDRRLAEEIPEIDIILGGHDHEPETYYNDRTFVHKSGLNAYYLTRLDLTIEKNDITGAVRVFPSWNVILNKDTPRDLFIGNIVDDLQTTLERITAEPIAIVGTPFNTKSSHIRSTESKFANVIVDSLRLFCEADVGFICGGLIRGNKHYEVGKMLTLKDFVTELPFQNVAVMVEMTGATLLAALENGVSKVEARAGRFPQVSGMEFVYDPNLPIGSRVQEVSIQGNPLDPKALYKVATVDYVLNGGDGYEMFKSSRVLLSPLRKVSLIELVVDRVKQMTSLTGHIEGRIKNKKLTGSLDDLLD
jgi:2',3'-cyclic-nucleotide 2'-phosphodiesterase (5'-nucleotidase family)